MGAAGALIRFSALLVIALCVRCSAVKPAPAEALKQTETIVGRATWHGNLALLTDVPALVVIDRVDGQVSRTMLTTADGAPLKPWGLGEAGGALYTVSDFVDLVKIGADGRTTRVGRLGRSLANLFDLDTGMAGQYASPDAGAALAVRVHADGVLSALRSPPRASHGLSTLEEGLLNLLSCSAPPRVICWLPARAALFEILDSALVPLADLERLPIGDPVLLVAGNGHRAIDDAIAAERGTYLILHPVPGAPGQQRLTTFDSRGRQTHTRPLDEPLRILLAVEGKTVVALARSGAMVSIEAAW